MVNGSTRASDGSCSKPVRSPMAARRPPRTFSRRWMITHSRGNQSTARLMVRFCPTSTTCSSFANRPSKGGEQGGRSEELETYLPAPSSLLHAKTKAINSYAVIHSRCDYETQHIRRHLFLSSGRLGFKRDM